MTSSADERNIKLLLEYDGSSYGGWQQQENATTIQGTLVAAVEAMTGEHVILHAAARTDAGVHALGQVVNFITRSTTEAMRFAPGLNFHTPDSISVHHSKEMPLDFNSRWSSTSKRYAYRVYCGPQPAALEERRAWLLRTRLDVDRMRRASEALIGDHDFNAFRSVHCDAKHARRTLFSIDVEHSPRPPLGNVVEIIIHGNAFCRHMCRIIVGTLVEVGRGMREIDDVAAALASRERTRAGVTAPGFGLTLLEVNF